MLTKHQQAILYKLSATLSERVSEPAAPHSYNADAVQRSLDKSRRDYSRQARRIHYLVKGMSNA